MPRDDWARENARAKYGPAPAKKIGKKKSGAEEREACRKKNTRDDAGPGNWNASSKLWFGKHKGKAIRDIPRDYLEWLVKQPEPTSWRLKRLRGFLVGYLASGG